jgi:hypothetical protein
MERLQGFLDVHHLPLMIVTGWPVANELSGSVGCLLTLGASSQVASATACVLSGDAEAHHGLPDGF